MDIMRFVVLAYASLILISLIASMFSIWAYHSCPANRSHRPLIFPIVCSISWFLVGVDQLVAVINRTHGTIDGLTLVLLTTITIVALIYFVNSYVMLRHQECALPIRGEPK